MWLRLSIFKRLHPFFLPYYEEKPITFVSFIVIFPDLTYWRISDSCCNLLAVINIVGKSLRYTACWVRLCREWRHVPIRMSLSARLWGTVNCDYHWSLSSGVLIWVTHLKTDRGGRCRMMMEENHSASSPPPPPPRLRSRASVGGSSDKQLLILLTTLP